MASKNQATTGPVYCNGCVDWSSVSNLALANAAKKGCLDCVNTAIAVGADVNVTLDGTGNTALLEAARECHFGCVQILAEAGADVNKEDSEQRTALIYAAMRGISSQCLEVLIRNGANVNKQDKFRFTPLICATYNGHRECASLLIEAGANVNSRDIYNGSALFFTLKQGYYDLSEPLIEAGADVNMIYENNETALMLALLRSHTECVDLLIRAGADVDTRSRTGETALSYALTGGSDACIRRIIEAGADGHGSLMLQTLVANETPGSFGECANNWKIKALLRAGAMVNIVDNLISLCSKSQRRLQRKKEVIGLLFVAGEKHFAEDTKGIFTRSLPPPKIKRLIDLCRAAIREHLLQLNQVNLFYRVPKLGLPASMTKFVLFEKVSPSE